MYSRSRRWKLSSADGDLAQAAGQPVVVGVDVGDDQVAHVGQADVERPQVALQGVQGVGGIPAAVDQQIAVVRAHQVRVDVAQRAVLQRQRQAPHAGQ